MKTKKFMKSKNLAYLNERLLQITLRRIKFQNSYRIMNVDIKQELSKENDGRLVGRIMRYYRWRGITVANSTG